MPKPSLLPTVVVIDDLEDDIFLFHQLLVRAAVACRLLPIASGDDAIGYLGRVAAGQLAQPLACFIDIKMPGCSGFDVLQAMRASDVLDRVSAIMLSSSDDRRDILAAYKAGAQCYLVKYPPAEVLPAVVDSAVAFAQRPKGDSKIAFEVGANLLPR